MNYLILAVLLSIAHTGSPIPRQTPNSPAEASHKNQDQAENKGTASNSTPSLIVSQREPITANWSRNDRKAQNTPNSITIRELPPVSVTRDWFDYLFWGFSGLLAITGILQIWVLYRTLRITAHQARIAQNQEKQMIAAGQQTERIIAQMKDTEVRDLRAYVGVSKAVLVAQNIWQPTVLVEFQNFGKTPAYNVRQWVGIAVYSHPLTVALPESSNPSTASALAMSPSVKNTLKTTLRKELPHAVKIGTSELTVYAYGRATYDDIFGNHWHTNYRFIFGGTEGGGFYRDENNVLCGAMGPDSEGNDAT